MLQNARRYFSTNGVFNLVCNHHGMLLSIVLSQIWPSSSCARSMSLTLHPSLLKWIITCMTNIMTLLSDMKSKIGNRIGLFYLNSPGGRKDRDDQSAYFSNVYIFHVEQGCHTQIFRGPLSSRFPTSPHSHTPDPNQQLVTRTSQRLIQAR